MPKYTTFGTNTASDIDFDLEDHFIDLGLMEDSYQDINMLDEGIENNIRLIPRLEMLKHGLEHASEGLTAETLSVVDMAAESLIIALGGSSDDWDASLASNEEDAEADTRLIASTEEKDEHIGQKISSAASTAIKFVKRLIKKILTFIGTMFMNSEKAIKRCEELIATKTTDNKTHNITVKPYMQGSGGNISPKKALGDATTGVVRIYKLAGNAIVAIKRGKAVAPSIPTISFGGMKLENNQSGLSWVSLASTKPNDSSITTRNAKTVLKSCIKAYRAVGEAKDSRAAVNEARKVIDDIKDADAEAVSRGGKLLTLSSIRIPRSVFRLATGWVNVCSAVIKKSK